MAASLFGQAGAAEPISLSLAQATDAALAGNADLHISLLGLAGAGGALEAASAAPNPTATFQVAGINPHQGIGGGPWRGKTADSTLRVDQLIERGGKRELRMENAAGLERAARGDVRDARRKLRIAVSLAYYDLLAAHDKLAIARQSEQLFDATVQAAEKRRKAGDLAGADVARARIDAVRARNDSGQAQSDYFAAQQALLVLMQRSENDLIVPSDPWPDQSAPPLRGEDVTRRADVRAAMDRLDAAAAAKRLALAARKPDVSVGVQAEHYPATAANPQGSGNSFGISLQMPIMVRNSFGGDIRAAIAAEDIARETLDKTLAAARSEGVLGNDRVRTALERVRRYEDELLPLAMRTADSAEFAFAHGALGIMDLLDVRRTYRAAQLEAIGARADYAKSLAPFHAAALEEETR